jgi:hypothetical protein
MSATGGSRGNAHGLHPTLLAPAAADSYVELDEYSGRLRTPPPSTTAGRAVHLLMLLRQMAAGDGDITKPVRSFGSESTSSPWKITWPDLGRSPE